MQSKPKLVETLLTKDLAALVKSIDSLPSLPPLYRQLMTALNNDSVPLSAIGDLIARDVSMSAEILRLVNSSYYGVKSKITSPQLAVNMLGLVTISALVLNIHIFSEITPSVRQQFGLDELWSHSINTAHVGQLIARREGLDVRISELAYIGGLLHDVGKVVLATKLSDTYLAILKLAKSDQFSLLDAERKILGTDHAAIGALLLHTWGLPEPVVRLVAYHHMPWDAPYIVRDPLPLVYVANNIEEQMRTTRSCYPKEKAIDMKYLAIYDMDYMVESWLEMIQTT